MSRREAFLDGTGSVEARRSRHPDIHENDIGIKLADLFDGFNGIPSLTDYLDIGFALQNAPQPLSKEGVVIDDQASNCHYFTTNLL
jgi:hypothetical protein